MVGVPLLLDTHVWIWLLDGAGGKLSPSCAETLRRAARVGGLFVSPISVWEVATLVRKGRIGLSLEIRTWVTRGLRAPGVHVSDFTPEIAIDSADLPGDPHGDPADRILIATARKLGGTLVTRDRHILEYAESGHLSALDAAA